MIQGTQKNVYLRVSVVNEWLMQSSKIRYN